MPAAPPDRFAYAILRVVPSLERGEQVNAGVVLFCRRRSFLEAAIGLDRERLAALAPGANVDEIEERLRTVERIAAGDPACGAIARLPASERFGWIVAPSSTTVQASPVHTGLTADPAETLRSLFARLVAAR